MSKYRFRLNPAVDVQRLRTAYARDGRIRVDALLEHADACLLRAAVVARDDWRQIINDGDKIFELDRAMQAALQPAQRAALDQAVAAGARAGFQYRYEAIRVPDSRSARGDAGDVLNAFATWLSSEERIAMFRQITGVTDIRFADAQATAYAPGDLLTAHDDAIAGKDRRAAFVFGLTSQWRAEWGGLLLFHHAGGRVIGEVPAFNTLDLFAVPQPHSVSQVTTAAPARRYAITGWLRAQAQPA